MHVGIGLSISETAKICWKGLRSVGGGSNMCGNGLII